MIFLLLTPLIVGVWFSAAWSADVTPRLPVPSEVLPEHTQAPGTLPPSRIDPGIERRPQTIPDPRSAVIPPKVDPKMAIDPETAPPSMEKMKSGGTNELPNEPIR